MGSTVRFDHVHLISADPDATASWYVEKFRAKETQRYEVAGAPQIVLAFEGGTLIVRGQRTGEKPSPKGGLEWGMDHFAFEISNDLDAFCEELKGKGVKFTMEPRQFNPTTQIAFIQAPDEVSIELLRRS